MTEQVPGVEDVERRWLEMIDGRRSREEVSAWAARWVEGDEPVAITGVVGLGLFYLHGADLVRVGGAGSDLVRHGGGGPYLRSVDELGEDLSYWRSQVRQHAADPVGWRRRRMEQARAAVAREQEG